MPDRDRKSSDDKTGGHPEGLPPEAHNDEQDGHGEQAQDVAADARAEESRLSGALESTKPAPGGFDPTPSSKGDLVDEMRRMEGEGRIDMSAFAGEPNHDDEPGNYGDETTDDRDEEWLTADGKDEAEEADLLDGEGLVEEVNPADDEEE